MQRCECEVRGRAQSFAAQTLRMVLLAACLHMHMDTWSKGHSAAGRHRHAPDRRGRHWFHLWHSLQSETGCHQWRRGRRDASRDPRGVEVCGFAGGGAARCAAVRMVRPFSLIAPCYIYICLYNMLLQTFAFFPAPWRWGLTRSMRSFFSSFVSGRPSGGESSGVSSYKTR